MNKLFAEAKTRRIPTGLVNGKLGFQLEESGFSPPDSDSDDNTTVYEQDYVHQEMKKYANFTNFPNGQDDEDGLSTVDDFEFPRNQSTDIYNSYNFKSNFTKPDLPIDSFRNKILQMIDINYIIIVQGDTGCGKTTQVSQYILDDCREKNEWCNIVVTQPRKIAAINVARRVCEERGWALGTVCGYQIGLERKLDRNTLITYMTTGVLLEKIIRAKSLHEYSHIIIDEVHERNQDLDFLLLVVRKFLFTNSPRTKVILMSATIVARDFAYYFRGHNSVRGEVLAPLITIDKKNVFTKQIFYADQLAAIKKLPYIDKNKPAISDMWDVFLFILRAFDKIDLEDPITKKKKIGSVLVFLPGIREIEEAIKLLEKYNRSSSNEIKWESIPLHSSLPNDEQAKVFNSPRAGHRKVILSTNIAESSITVPDICFVIDFCLTKVMVVDPLTKYCSLQLEWASHVNCEQRAGRVGRVANGRVYRLVTTAFYEKHMETTSVPEILRAPLENVVLKSKMLNLHDTPKQILALSMNPPNLKNIDTTIWNLKEVGGLLQTCRGVKSSSDGDITFLGTVMAGLPLDVRLSKLIILGQMFSCLEEAIIIAAGCSIQNIFSIPFNQKFLAYKKLLIWSDGSCSDTITLINLYNVWISYKRDNRFRNTHEAVSWCKQNFVSYKGMTEWTLLIKEIKERLERFNIMDSGGLMKVNLGVKERPTVLKVITCGAFYPNYYIRSADCGQVDEREAVRIVGGRNPHRTVYLTGFDNTQPGELYVRQIKKMFTEEESNEQNINVHFDGSCKIYVEFKRKLNEEFLTVDVNGRSTVARIPGDIPIQIYECIRKRQLNCLYNLKLLAKDEAWKWADKYGLTKDFGGQNLASKNTNCFSHVDYNPIPTLDVEFISIHITQTNDAGHFWCQHINEETQALSMIIERELNRQVLHPAIATVQEAHELNSDTIYAARWSADNKFYRCRISASSGKYAYIHFIDYGNVQKISVDQIYELPNQSELQTAPLAMECMLAGVKPSLQKNPQGVWSVDANECFSKIVDSKVLMAKVYSVVDDVLHLELFYKGRDRKEYCVNNDLIKQGFAVECKESFLSEEDHQKRQLVLSADNPNSQAALMATDGTKKQANFNTPTYHANYIGIAQLKGPYSPLEMRVFGVIESSINKRVDIEQSSVNAVLLDTQPNDPQSMMLVAGCVMQGQSGNNLKLRQTTIMPNIPGLPAIMAMLFCPTMEPKLNDDGSRVASILCGMGCHEITERSLHPVHDMLIVLDTLLTVEEIDEINNLRFLMNSCVKAMSSNSNNQNDLDQDQITYCQKKIIDSLFRTLCRSRTPVEKVNVKFANCWQKSVSDAVVLQPGMSEEPEDIWPLLWFVKLNEGNEKFGKIRKNLEELSSMAKSMIPATQTVCVLCDESLFDAFEIRKHLVSKQHKANNQAFQEKLLFNSEEY